MTYQPSDDTILLAECASGYRGESALEIGVGSGLVTKTLERTFKNVIGSDIDFHGLQSCKSSCNAMLVCCDAASAFVNEQIFDLIVSNPPYLRNANLQNRDSTVDGGRSGMETTIHFIQSALPLLVPTGKMLIVTSSLTDDRHLDTFIRETKMRKRTLKNLRVFFETLSVVELSF